MPAEGREQLRSEIGAGTERARTINIMFLGMHASVPQFQNKLVRQAVNYAIDREGITRKGVLKGMAYPMEAHGGARPVRLHRRAAAEVQLRPAAGRSSCWPRRVIRTASTWSSWCRSASTTRSRRLPRRSGACWAR